MKHTLSRRGFIGGVCALSLQSMLSACSFRNTPKIGLMLDDLRVLRWGRDRDYFVAEAKKLGATVTVKWANNDENHQVKQFLELVENKVDAIVILPINGKLFKDAVAKAVAAGIKVIAYDRMIFADIDAYVAVDSVEVGRLQVESILKAVPKGNYFLLGGAETDDNARVGRQVHLEKLKPYVDKGDINIVGMEWVKDWDPAIAAEIIADALERKIHIDAIVASNDGTAGAVIDVLGAKGLAGKIPISGLDAELDACKRILKGTQTMTVDKHLKDMATLAANTAFSLVSGQDITYERQLDNGLKKVNAKLLKPTLVNKDNMNQLVAEGVYTRAQLGLK